MEFAVELQREANPNLRTALVIMTYGSMQEVAVRLVFSLSILTRAFFCDYSV